MGPRRDALWLSGTAFLALAVLAMPPAAAQQMRGSSPEVRLGTVGDRLHPIESDLGMPIRAGEVNLRARAGIPSPGTLSSTVLGLNAGLTDFLTLELRAPFLTLGGPAGPGYFTSVTAGGQVGLWRSPGDELGLSLSVGAEMAGGPAGLDLTAIQPLLGLRSRATVGPMQSHLNVFARPIQNSVSWQLATMWHLTEGLAPGIEFTGTAGLPGSLTLVPEVKFRPIQNLALGFGYQVPLSGAPGQILAQAELLF